MALSPVARDRIAGGVAAVAACAIAGGFLWILGDLVVAGLGELDWEFLGAAPRDAGRAGGILPILVSTGLILVVTLAAALPLALPTAVLLSEWGRRMPRFGSTVRFSLDLLSGIPSIVFGLFGMVFFGRVCGMGDSILAGGLTLACMILPLLVRFTEEGLRAVDDRQRRAAAALGLSRSTTVRRVLLPAAWPAIAAGLVLGVGRALAETAALLFTSGYVDRMPGSLLDSGRALSVHIFDLAFNVPGAGDRAAATALILIAALLAINGAIVGLLRRWARRRRI